MLLVDTDRTRDGATVVPLPEEPVPAERFGVATGSLLWGLPPGEVEPELRRIRALGARWVRSAVRWDGVERSRGRFVWTRVDALVDAAEAADLRLVVTIAGSPEWARPPDTLPAAFPSDPADYGTFVRALARRYSGRVSAWELGNEPNHVKAFAQPDATRYAEYLRAGAEAIRAEDPDALVLTGGIGGTNDTNGDIPGDQFVRDLYAAGAQRWFDVVSYHPYTYPLLPSDDDGTRGWSRLLQVREFVAAQGGEPAPIWITEFGAPTGGPSARRRVTEVQQAAILRDGVRLNATYEWSGPLFWFAHRDKGDDPKEQSDHFGLWRVDGRPKLAADEYVDLAAGASR